MKMRSILTILIGISFFPTLAHAQEDHSTHAITRAVAHIRSDLPQGRVFLIDHKLPPETAAEAARAIGAERRQKQESIKCVRARNDPQLSSCYLIDGAAGAISVQRWNVSNDKAVIYLTTHQTVESSIRKLVYAREFEVTLKRGSGNAWSVIRSKLVAES